MIPCRNASVFSSSPKRAMSTPMILAALPISCASSPPRLRSDPRASGPADFGGACFRVWKNLRTNSQTSYGKKSTIMVTTSPLSASYETMAVIGKGQVNNIDGNDIHAQTAFVACLFQMLG